MGDPNRRTPEMDEALRTSTGALELPAFESLTDEQVKSYIQNGFIACVHHPYSLLR